MAVTATATRSRDLTGAVLGLVAAAQILPGLLAFLAPGTFFDRVAPFAPRNDHLVRDVGSWQIALGLAALVAVRRPSWRLPMLGILTVQYALHTVSHLVDVHHSDPAWVGPVELGLQAALTAALAALAWRERRSV